MDENNLSKLKVGNGLDVGSMVTTVDNSEGGDVLIGRCWLDLHPSRWASLDYIYLLISNICLELAHYQLELLHHVVV